MSTLGQDHEMRRLAQLILEKKAHAVRTPTEFYKPHKYPGCLTRHKYSENDRVGCYTNNWPMRDCELCHHMFKCIETHGRTTGVGCTHCGEGLAEGWRLDQMYEYQPGRWVCVGCVRKYE